MKNISANFWLVAYEVYHPFHKPLIYPVPPMAPNAMSVIYVAVVKLNYYGLRK